MTQISTHFYYAEIWLKESRISNKKCHKKMLSPQFISQIFYLQQQKICLQFLLHALGTHWRYLEHNGAYASSECKGTGRTISCEYFDPSDDDDESNSQLLNSRSVMGLPIHLLKRKYDTNVLYYCQLTLCKCVQTLIIACVIFFFFLLHSSLS